MINSLTQEMQPVAHLRQKNPKDTAKIPLKYFAYGFGSMVPIKFNKQSEFLKMKDWGFLTNPPDQDFKRH